MMLRILISLVLVFAAAWFMLKNGNDNNKVFEQQVKDIEMAKAAAQATSRMSASMAKQSDAIRDQAMGVLPPDPANPEQ